MAGTKTGEDGRRAAILDAAAQLIAERGFHAVRVSDIAKLVGSSTGSVHYYFPAKDDVLISALQRAIDRAMERQGQELRRIDDAHQRLLKLIDMQLPRVGAVRDEWAIWVQFWAEATVHPKLRPLHKTYYARWHDAVARTVSRGQHQGVFRQDIDPQTVSRRITAMTDGLAIQVLTAAPGMTVTSMRETLVDFVEESLLASVGHPA